MSLKDLSLPIRHSVGILLREMVGTYLQPNTNWFFNVQPFNKGLHQAPGIATCAEISEDVRGSS